MIDWRKIEMPLPDIVKYVVAVGPVLALLLALCVQVGSYKDKVDTLIKARQEDSDRILGDSEHAEGNGYLWGAYLCCRRRPRLDWPASERCSGKPYVSAAAEVAPAPHLVINLDPNRPMGNSQAPRRA